MYMSSHCVMTGKQANKSPGLCSRAPVARSGPEINSRACLRALQGPLLEPSRPVQDFNGCAFYLVNNGLKNYESLLFLFLPPVTSSVLKTNILSFILVSDTLYLCDRIRVAGTASY